MDTVLSLVGLIYYMNKTIYHQIVFLPKPRSTITTIWHNDISIGHVSIDSSTPYLAFYTVRLHCQTPTLIPTCRARRQFMVVFGMTRPGCEPMAFRMRGGHANHVSRPDAVL